MWGYGSIPPLLTSQMLLSNQHPFTRSLHATHPTLLHTPTLHSTLHSPSIHHNPSPFHHIATAAAASSSTPSVSTGLKTEASSVGSSKSSEEDPKVRLFITPADATSANVQLPLQPGIAPQIASSLGPAAIQPALSSTLQPGLSSVLPAAAINPGLASTLQPNLTPALPPHYLVPPTSLSLYCPKPPLFPLSAFVHAPTSPLLSVITETTTVTTASSAHAVTVTIPATDVTTSASITPQILMPTPPLAATSPQMARSPFSKIESLLQKTNTVTTTATASCSSVTISTVDPLSSTVVTTIESSKDATPAVITIPKRSPLYDHQGSLSSDVQFYPKIKVCNAQSNTGAKVNRATVERNIIGPQQNTNISIKREIKQEIVSPHLCSERHDAKDVNFSNPKPVIDEKPKQRIKQEFSVPVASKTSVGSSENLNPTVSAISLAENQSVQLQCINSNDNRRIISEIPSIVDETKTFPELTVTTTETQTPPSIKINDYSQPTLSPLSKKESIVPISTSVHSITETNLASSNLLSGVTTKDTTDSCRKLVHNNSQVYSSPVQEQALDLSGLELLSQSVLQYEKQTSFQTQQKDTSTYNSCSNQGSTEENNNSKSEGFETAPKMVSESIKANSKRDPVEGVPVSCASLMPPNDEDSPEKIRRSSSSSNQPSNFSLLCALAEQVLTEKTDSELRVDSVAVEQLSPRPPNDTKLTIVETNPSSLSVYEESHNQQNNLREIRQNSSTLSSSVLDSSKFVSSHNSNTQAPNSANSDRFTCSTLSPNVAPNSECAFNSMPLDLSISLPRKVDVVPVVPNPVTMASVSTSTETDLIDNQTEIYNSSRSFNIKCRYDSTSLEEKLYCSYDSSSSDSQNFEGFDDTSRKTELNARKQFAYIALKYEANKNKFSNSRKRKSGRSLKRKRFHSESIDRKFHNSKKKLRLEHYREQSSPSLEAIQELRPMSYHDDKIKMEDTKHIPKLTISGLKPHKLGNQYKLSQKRDVETSSEYEDSSDEENNSSLPVRRWSYSVESTSCKLYRSRKLHDPSHFSKSNAESDDHQLVCQRSGSSDRDSKLAQSEFSSSDHELNLTSCSASKKRKPGRPKKHSPNKKHATETIVSKKHKTKSFVMQSPSAGSSARSKVKPKLKAEVRSTC